MKRILVVDPHQFGYHTDTYAYCRWLRTLADITVVCWDYGEPRIILSGVTVVYVSRAGGQLRRLARYLRSAATLGRSRVYDVWFIVHFFGCSLLRLIARDCPKIVDLRSGSVRTSSLRRSIENLGMRMECSLFRHITVISESLGNVLGFARNRYAVLPLGGEPVDVPLKTFESLRLFYVGTLSQRDIHKTVDGLDRFLNECQGSVDVTYDIVGGGPVREREQLLESIRRSSWKDRMIYHGRIPNADLHPYLERANVGVAFIPMTPYYDCQPSTKVFEYLLAGMPVLATATSMNAAVIGPDNGILHEDTVEGFCQALRKLAETASSFDSRMLRNSGLEYSWEHISRNILLPLLLKVADEKP